MERYSKNPNAPSAEDKALDRFTDLMIDKIKSIKEDWQKPWFTEGALAWPRNLTGRRYNGGNALMLMLHAEKEAISCRSGVLSTQSKRFSIPNGKRETSRNLSM